MTAISASGLPPKGSVLGVDVGFSPKRKSSAVCRLDWTESSVAWSIRRFRAIPEERRAILTAVAGDRPLLAAAFDGPLRTGFDVIGKYRVAESMLTRRLASKIGKPGQASAPVGKLLNAAANDCASTVLVDCHLAAAKHHVRIDDRAILEAFPSSFLGLMLTDPSAVIAERGNRSDLFFSHLAGTRELERLTLHLLPGRALAEDFLAVSNHDDRAGLICALTALTVAADDYTAVGDSDGYIILPPAAFVQPWAWAYLEANASLESRAHFYSSRKQGWASAHHLADVW